MDTKKVSISLAVQRALETMGDEYTRYEDKMRVFGVEGDNRIGPYSGYERKIYVLDIEDCRVSLPLGTKAVIGVFLGDHGCDCGQDFEYANRITRDSFGSYGGLAFGDISVGGAFTGQFNSADRFTATSGSILGCSNVKWYIQDNQIIFEGGIGSISKVTVQVLCYELDDDGIPMINHAHVQAVAKYVEWQMAEHLKWKVGRQFTQNDRLIMQREWNRLCSDARVSSSKMSESQYRETVQLLTDPLAGHGLLLNNDYTEFYGGY